MVENRTARVGVWIALGIMFSLFMGSVLVNVGLMSALLLSRHSSSGDYPVDEYPDIQEEWSMGYGDSKVARIELYGPIMRGSPERIFGTEVDMVESILQQIRAATVDENVDAILLEIDSPGGAVTPSDEIYTALQSFKKYREERKVVAFIRGLGASGAYYAAMAADYVVAEPTAIVGSVGVIMQSMNLKGLGDKLGIQSVTITSGKNKAMLSPLEEVDPEHVRLLQELLDQIYDRFASLVVASRGLPDRSLLDGRVFISSTAKEVGLIDEVGYWQDATSAAKRLLGEEELYIIRYHREMSFMESLLGAYMPKLPSLGAQVNESPSMLYLWKP